MTDLSRRAFLTAGSAALAIPVRPARSAELVKVIVGSAAGIPPDIVSRIVANALGATVGTVVVENKPGAMQTIGGSEVLRRPADGRTLFGVAMASSVAPALLRNPPYEFEKAFVAVAEFGTAYHVLVVHPSVPAHSLQDLVRALRVKPDAFNFSSGGFGSPAHMAGELFKQVAGVQATHVVYQNLPGAIVDLLSGRNQFQFITPLPVLALISSGKLRALAVTSPERLPFLPNVPTVVEAGFPELIIQDWMGVVARRGTPSAALDEVNAAVNQVLGEPEIVAKLERLGAIPTPRSRESFQQFIEEQVIHWRQVVRQAGISLEN